jgi:hypothetical protein
MNNFLADSPMNSTVTEPLDFGGEHDVVNQLKNVINSVDEEIVTDVNRLTVINDVYAQLKETRSRVVKWSNGDPQYCSALNNSSFLDLSMIELFGLCDHIPIGPDGLLNDVLYEAREPWFLGLDQWSLSTLEVALEMLCTAREGIQVEQEIMLNN